MSKKEKQQYIPRPPLCKSAAFNNEAGMEVKLLIRFDSGTMETHTVANWSSCRVEKQIKGPTTTSFDPIVRVELIAADGKKWEFDVKSEGVEDHTYMITVRDNKLVCEKLLK